MDSRWWSKPFRITSIRRQDLRGILTDEEIARLDDGAMREIAKRLAGGSSSSSHWVDLQIIAEYVLKGLAEREAGT